VEGNWCLLNNHDKNIGDADTDNVDTSRQIRHRYKTTTTRSRKKSRNNKRINDKSTRKRKRSCDDDDDDGADFFSEDDTDMVVSAMKKPHRCCTQNTNRLDQIWMGMFEKLVAYKEQHINTMVPQHYDEDPKLGRWVDSQRTIYKKDELNPNRVDLLKSIGFDWYGVREAIEQTVWTDMFQKLVAYENLHTNTKVPQKYNENPRLRKWVFNQRHAYKNDKLLPNRYALLKSIGFKWNGIE
jgi:hypothetical protein